MDKLKTAVIEAVPLLKHYKNQLLSSLSCDSRSHDNDKEPLRLINNILSAIPNNMIEIKFVKTHPDAKLPCKSSSERDNPLTGDSGYDIFAVEDKIIPARNQEMVDVGLTLGFITPGYWFKIESRSGLSLKYGVTAHPGIVDNGYRNSLGILLRNSLEKDYQVKTGDKIAQLVIYPIITANMEFTEQTEESHRKGAGWGSSGK